MRKFSLEACVAFLLFILLLIIGACDRLGDSSLCAHGQLCVAFDAPQVRSTKARLDLPDTCDFILSIIGADGKSVYEGSYGGCPETLNVPAGSYTVRAVSEKFTRPAFDFPQFGDEQCVVVPSGGRVNVSLVCAQMNAGVSLDVSEDFLTECPDAVLFLRSSAGKLMYSYSEKRIAYFPPGTVSLVMSRSAGETILVTRDLVARDMLSVKVSVAAGSNSKGQGISMQLDTARVWVHEECTIGEASVGYADEVLTVAQARTSAGKEDVWVSGYIVGGDLTSASASFASPFKSKTNILLGPRSTTADRGACISVQLPEGSVRDALNLVSNPDMLGRRVHIKGDIVEAYYGLPGMKNTMDYQLF
jgi:hypothetical protein